MPPRPTVAVIGGGFSGVLTALHLLADPHGPQVRLVERSASFGRGAAYATANPDHLLNVRVANMSAYPDDPGHFMQWLAGRPDWSAQGGFVTRGVYGDYLQDLLRQAVRRVGAGRLLLESDEAVDVAPASGGWQVDLALGRRFEADIVVMALGVLRPGPPPAAPEAVVASPRYFADPWSQARELPSDADDVLLIGAGLTMVDAALTHARPGRKFWTISRRGLLPRTHGLAVYQSKAPKPDGSPLAVLRDVRRRAAAVEDWREAVDAIRPHVRQIWQTWSLAQRRQFLRHLRPWWDVHRHRLAPGAARKIQAMISTHQLTLLSGRIERLSIGDAGVAVSWRPRRSHVTRRLNVGAIVNCTGMAGDVEASGDPLVRRLVDGGVVRPDPCRLGLDVDGLSRLIDAGGRPHEGLFAVGALTRGAFWEITSVPDIRVQAQEVAGEVLRRLSPIGLRQA